MVRLLNQIYLIWHNLVPIRVWFWRGGVWLSPMCVQF